MRNSALQRILKGITGVVFIGFGAKLATIRP
jgi:threonine/homoserine/homoserine lactone efflux protein